jgi:hypothetical protein
MLYFRGDVRKKEREALHAITPRRRKEEGAESTACYTLEET